MTDPIVAFYAARLAEEENYARSALAEVSDGKAIRVVSGELAILPSAASDMLTLHIVLHNPARTLREVERGRRLISRYTLAAQAVQRGSAASFTAGQDSGYAEACLDAIREAAAVHDGHPAYRSAWRP